MGKIADKSDAITEEMWLSCNEFNRTIIDEYLETAMHLSPKSFIQYKSALRMYAYWLKLNCNNIPNNEVKSRDYLRFQNWLVRKGIAESTIKLKRSAISNLNNYIMVYYEEEFPTFRNYINKQIKVPKTGCVHDKVPLTPDEYIMLCNELEKREEWQKLAYLKFTYITGCRRAESRQLLKEVVTYPPIIKKVKMTDSEGKQTEVEIQKYKTHDTRCKGSGSVGKVRKLEYNEEVLESLKKWLEIRGEDNCPYMFVTHGKNGYKQVSETTFNQWCSGLFTDIVKRRVHPHLFRESRATNLVVHSGKTLEMVRKLLGHESSDTTKIYVIDKSEEEADEVFAE